MMKAALQRLHGMLGDFWWYSLMLFCACRAADLLNAFVGLWLVPKYVDPSELGAVMPLAQFANFLAIPAAAFASAFRNEVSRLSVERRFGQLRTLIRGVFVATAVFLLLAVVAARLTMPLLLERIRIVEGSLGVVIIAVSLVGAVSPIYTNALQALKKFKAQSAVNVIGAPVRLVVMLVSMPFRALTGYFVGQASVPAFNIFASVFCLRRELSVPAEPYWRRETFRKFSALLSLFLVWGAVGGIYGLVEATVIRQRLPDLDSAGYYMATRFSEIATYLFAAVNVALFPMAADFAGDEGGRMRLIVKATMANVIFCALVAVASWAFGRQVLAMLPHGELYMAYWWAIPWLTTITAIGSVAGFYTTAETAAGRFGFLRWIVPIELLYPAILLLVTGCGYFTDRLPAPMASFLHTHNVRSLDTMLLWMTTVNAVKACFCICAMARSRRICAIHRLAFR